jgi:PAS domain S-box-containing protein
MNPIAKFVVERPLLAWCLAALAAAVIGILSFLQVRDMRELERLDHLQTEAERRTVEIMSQTINGNLMGAVAVLGLIDPAIKQEALGKLAPNSQKVLPTLQSIAVSYDADGVFVVAETGVATSSWDNSGKPSTGLNLKFRPYYQMAMQGMDNVYAAVSLARGDRSLYFSAPIFSETTNGTQAIGAVVARTNLLKVDNLLRDKGDIALLLSPQGIVFASSRKEWIGYMSGQATPERLKAIRELKQFGNMFESKTPTLLPLGIDSGLREFEGRRVAVAASKLQWNDPFGEWTLVLVEDLDRTLSANERNLVGVFGALIVLLVGALFLNVLRSHYRQVCAGQQLEIYAREQEASAIRKARTADATLHFQRASSLPALIQAFLEEAHTLFGALQGVVYIHSDEEDLLTLAGSYACSDPPAATLTPGDGLLGQCAVERTIRTIAVAPEGFATIRSGLGETRPACVIMAPLIVNDKLLGVAEIALLHDLNSSELATFEELLGLLAMNIGIVRRSSHTEAVLSATRAAELANAEQLAFQQALVDTIPYPVFYKDAETRYLGVNRAYEECFGVRRADLIGKRISEATHLSEGDGVAYQTEDEATLAAADTVKREVQVPFADGKVHDAIYSVSGFHRLDGSPGGLIGTFIDISDIKNAQRELLRLSDAERFNRLARGREQRIVELKREINALATAAGSPEPYGTALIETVNDHEFTPHPDYRTDLDVGKPVQLADLIDLGELQVLFSNFCEAVGIASAIIDLQGNVLTAARWQRVCTDFHRAIPASCARCIESDTQLALKLEAGETFTLYTCKNGMTDAASPILVDGVHLANVFIGQFHLGSPDLAFFRQQAKQFGYDEQSYLDAVIAAPVLDEQRLPTILNFLTGFSRMIASMALAKQRADAAQIRLQEQADLLKHERVAALSLAEDAEQARQALEFVAKEAHA